MDFELLLKKYMTRVIDSEGMDYLRDEDGFSPEEIGELRRISEEIGDGS